MTDAKELVIYEREGHVATITLNRPDKRNALNQALWEGVDEAVAKAEADTEARAVILRGNGKSFCAGLDLGPDNEIVSKVAGPPGATQKIEFYQLVRRFQAMHNRLERLRQPTIALLHGHCFGAGLEMALCCDIRLCAAETLFAMPELKLAFIMDVGGLQRLPKVVGRGPAREIIFRGNRFGAEYAKSIQLVNAVHDDVGKLYAAGLEIAEDIAACPPLAVQGAKEVILFGEDDNIDHKLDYNAARSAMIIPSEDLGEAMMSYMQKRKGDFKGA